MTDGLRMPAEWEPHRSTWISWPHNRDTWPGAFESVEPAYREMVRALAASEPVDINVLNAAHRRHVAAVLDGIDGEIRLHEIPTNDAWCRDHGATFVRTSGGLAAVDFRYNAWGGKYPPFDLDQKVAAAMASRVGAEHVSSDLYLEGGAIEVNGQGLLLTTESCVLNANRNPDLDREEAEAALNGLLGTSEVVWVSGDLAGDDTDGHIDNLARFVTPEDVVMVVPGSPDDAEHAPLQDAFAALEQDGLRLGFRVHRLPLPEPHYHTDADGVRHRLPASHANFYIANRSVVIPAYGGPSDGQAVDLLAGFFPDREMVLLDCRDIVWGLGAVHCLTQQVPA